MNEFLKEFIVESSNHLDAAEAHLLELSQGKEVGDGINACFRAIHTIKGTAGFLGLSRILALAHAGEQVLEGMRSRVIGCTPTLIDLLLETVTRLRDLIHALEQEEAEAAGDDSDWIAVLTNAALGQAQAAKKSATPAPETLDSLLGNLLSLSPDDSTGVQRVVGSLGECARRDAWPQAAIDLFRQLCGFAADCERAPASERNAVFSRIVAIAGELFRCVAASPTALGIASGEIVPDRPHGAGSRLGDVLVELGVSRETVETVAASLTPGERLGDRLVDAGVITRQEVEQAVAHQAYSLAEGVSRVATIKLEELVNQVGELLIAQAMIQQDPALEAAPRLAQALARQSRIIRELQVLSLGMRIVPIKSTFQKMARAIHDTARKLGKQVSFVVTGEDTEIDRALTETLSDSLLHMVRNAIDHGLEPSGERLALGKSAIGTVRLTAWNTSDYVFIQLADDGRGMDPAKLRAKGEEKGLINPTAPLSEEEAFQLIFLPGFSTAASVTGISGRGVGLDVVRRHVIQIGGSIDIESAVGLGTTFTLRLPLTTAILNAVLLRVGEQRYLVPISAIVEAIRPEPGRVQHVIQHGRVIESRGRLLPVLRLADIFAVENAALEAHQAIILVIEHFSGCFALQVDDIVSQQQVVIKPFDNNIRRHPAVSGTAILGDGCVGLILDTAKLVEQSICPLLQ